MKKFIAFLFFISHFSFLIYCQNAPIVVNYSFEAAVQHFTVPPGVTTITVTIAGAQGGGILGGKGASFMGICTVTSCEVLSVVVGQQGWEFADTGAYSGGGGGASWIYDSSAVLYNPIGSIGLIAIAAGGGGAGSSVFGGIPFTGWHYFVGGQGGVDLFTNATTMGVISIFTSDTLGGTGGNGGAGTLNAGGGAGWLSDGKGSTCYHGRDEANHFAITNCNYTNAEFGGGGASSSYTESGLDGVNGGGGGGYNGGRAGSSGGGGGSYLNGTLSVATASDTGNGSVTISYQQPTGIIDYPCDSPGIGIYPNPTTGIFVVTGVLPGQVITMYNYLGQKIMSTQVNSTFMQFNLSTFANGVYIVIVHNADGSFAGQGKVVKIQ